MQRRRIGAAAAAAVTVGAVAVATATDGAVRLWQRSDVATTRIELAGGAVRALPPGPLPVVVRRLWSAATRAAGGPPVQTTTVVVAGDDQVAGVDPGTGLRRWSYRRGNARLCGWTAQDDVVVAAFGNSSGCTDLTALDATTGQRRWYRNADLGPDTTLVGAPGVVVARSGDHLLAVDSATGLNRWTDSRTGCTLSTPVAGRQNVVVLARCGGVTDLIDHDPYGSQQLWSVRLPAGTAARVLAADAAADTVAVLVGRGPAAALRLYDRAGHSAGTLADVRLAGADQPGDGTPATVSTGSVLLIWTGTEAVAVRMPARNVLWAVATVAPAVLDGNSLLLAEPAAANGRTGLVERNPDDGHLVRRIAVAGDLQPAAAGTDGLRGATLARVGRVLVAATAGTTSSYG